MPQYTTFDDVKAILDRGQGESNYFSDCVTSVSLLDDRRDQNLDIMFDHTQIDFPETFSEYTTWVLEIDAQVSGAYEYTVYEEDDMTGQRQKLDAGRTDNDLTVSPYGVTIPSAVWGGTIEVGDTVGLDLHSYLSTDNAKQIIDESERMIDGWVEAYGAKLNTNSSSRLFSGAVPSEITIAAKYLAAYYIYVGVYSQQKTDQALNQSGVKAWKRRAEKYVDQWIEKQGHHGPKVASFPALVDYQGVSRDDCIGPGFQEYEEGVDALDQAESEMRDIFGVDSDEWDQFDYD